MMSPDCRDEVAPTAEHTGSRAGTLLAPLLGVVAVAVAVILLWLGVLPMGIPGQWCWPLRAVPVFPALPTFFGITVAVAAAAYVGYVLRARPSGDQVGIAVVLCTLATLSMMLGLYSAEPFAHIRTARVTCAIAALPYYGAAVEAGSVGEIMRLYAEDPSRRGQPDRLRTHPPGVAAYYVVARRAIIASPTLMKLARNLFTSSGLPAEEADRLTAGVTNIELTPDDVAAGTLASIFITCLGALIPAACFVLATALVDTRTALQVTLLCSVIPSVVIVTPSIEGVGVVIALCAAGALFWSVRLSSHRLHGLYVLPALVSGLLWAAAYYWTVGLLALALPAAAVIACYALQPEHRRQALTAGGVAVAAFIGAHVVTYLFTGYSPLAHIPAIAQAQREIMHHGGRGRLTWLGMNLYDFVLFLGPALTIAAIAGFSRLLRGLRSLDAFGALCLGGLAALVLLDLSGTTRGEVGRIWVFLMPFFAMAATQAAWVRRQTAARIGFALIVIAQALYAALLHAHIVPVGV